MGNIKERGSSEVREWGHPRAWTVYEYCSVVLHQRHIAHPESVHCEIECLSAVEACHVEEHCGKNVSVSIVVFCSFFSTAAGPAQQRNITSRRPSQRQHLAHSAGPALPKISPLEPCTRRCCPYFVSSYESCIANRRGHNHCNT